MNKTHFKSVSFGFLTAALVAMPGLSAAAAVGVSAHAYDFNNASAGDLQQTSSSSGSAQISATYADSGLSSSAAAYADFGILKVSGETSATAGTDSSNNSLLSISTAYSYWVDSLTVTSPDFSGNAILTANIWLDGEFDGFSTVNGNSYVRGVLDIFIGGNRALYASESAGWVEGNDVDRASFWSTYSSESGVEGLFRLYTLALPIQLGNAFDLYVGLTGSAYAQAVPDADNPGSAASTYDLGHSLYWAGITGLHDEAGNVITDYSVVSDAGFNYRNSLVPIASVPEPAAMWLFLSGVLGLGFAKRRRA
jgi:hypothetical protein